MMPASLSDWNYEVIRKLAEKYLETDMFEFKYQIAGKDPKYNQSIVNTACAFANTRGGFIIFGVHDMGGGRTQIEGIEKSDDLAKEFGDKIRPVNPAVYFEFLNPPIVIPGTSRVLLVIYIPQSPDRPHMTDQGRFYYRTNEGNRIMSYEQVKEAMLRYEERKHKLNLLYIELLSNLSIAKGMLISESDIGTRFSLLSFDTTVISDLLPEVYSIIRTDRELVNLLVRLRLEMGVVNSKVRIFHTQSIMPVSGLEGIVKAHNQFVRDKIDNNVLPLITKIIEVLESRFGLRNPVKE